MTQPTPLTRWVLPRGTLEWVGPITVDENDEPTTGFELAVLPRGIKPEADDDVWEAPLALGPELGVLVGRGSNHVLAPGVHRVWVKVTDASPEIPVREVGTVVIM